MADILTSSTMLNLDISIWTGKAKLKRTEVDDSALPPEELVTLGSKKIFDPAKLKRFHGIKSNAFTACNRYGVKCMGGWLVDNSYLQLLLSRLEDQRALWDDEVRKFLATYQMECDDWLAANPQWVNILANALPRQGEIAKKFNFGWQVFNIVPAPTGTNGDQTQDELDIVPTRAIEKMAKEIEETLPVYAPGKTFKAGPLRRLAEAANALAFSSPEVDKLTELLNKLVVAGSQEIAHIMLGKLADPKELAAICVPGKPVQDILNSAVTSGRAALEPQPEPQPEPVQAAAKPLPDIGNLLADAQSVLKKQGEPAQVDLADTVYDKQCVAHPESTVDASVSQAAETKPEQDSAQQGNQQALDSIFGAIDSEGLW